MKLTDCELEAINASLPGDLELHKIIGVPKIKWHVLKHRGLKDINDESIHVREIFSRRGEVSFKDIQLYHKFLFQEAYARIVCVEEEDGYIDYNDEENVGYWDTVMTFLENEWLTEDGLDSIAIKFGIVDVTFFDMTVFGEDKDYKIYAAWIEDESLRKNQ